MAYNMLLAGAACVKHEGFHEEREWRAIYAPKRWPSPLMDFSTEVIRGIPQTVYKIPIDATKGAAVADLDFVRIFDRLIIGPTPYSWPVYEAFGNALAAAGVTDVAKKMCQSGIPIRA